MKPPPFNFKSAQQRVYDTGSDFMSAVAWLATKGDADNSAAPTYFRRLSEVTGVPNVSADNPAPIDLADLCVLVRDYLDDLEKAAREIEARVKAAEGAD